jgi:hypothetical protein
MSPKEEPPIENNKEEKKQESLDDKITNPEQDKKRESRIDKFLKNSSHPIICLFTVLFKVLSLLSFLILEKLTEKKSVIYLATILFGSADFWVTKNLSGRLLVGLRWWNEVKENGEEVWIFESKNEKKEATSDKSVFWICLYLTPIVWFILIIFNIFQPARFIIGLICLIFTGTNLYGYFKCSKDQQGKLKSFGGKLAVNTIKKGAKKGLEMGNEQK